MHHAIELISRTLEVSPDNLLNLQVKIAEKGEDELFHPKDVSFPAFSEEMKEDIFVMFTLFNALNAYVCFRGKGNEDKIEKIEESDRFVLQDESNSKEILFEKKN